MHVLSVHTESHHNLMKRFYRVFASVLLITGILLGVATAWATYCAGARIDIGPWVLLMLPLPFGVALTGLFTSASFVAYDKATELTNDF